jgi:hypothetical protein
MELGAFSISLSVKDLEVSESFLQEIRIPCFWWGRGSELVDPDGNPILIDQHV